MNIAAVLVLAPLLLPACATGDAAPRPRPAAPPDPAPALTAARAADDAALKDAGASLAPLDGHFVAVAGGRVLGGTLLPGDTADLLSTGAPDADHAYFFVLGTGGDRKETPPALYEPRPAGKGMLAAMGFPSAAGGGERSVRVTMEPASGLGNAAVLDLVVARGWSGTALVGAADAAALGLARSEIPGTVEVVELLTGKTHRYRRALVRAAPATGGEAAPRPPVLVEILYPR
jgi:hypothetical protein